MAKTFREKRALAMDRFDKRYVQLEEWTTRLIRAAKKVESLRRECKALRGKCTVLGQLVEAQRKREQEERKLKRRAAVADQAEELAADVAQVQPHDDQEHDLYAF